MNINNLYINSRKIHRLFVIVTSVFTLLLMLTGAVLKYPIFFADFSFINQLLIRKAHSFLSLFAVVSLTIMIVTGLIMYFYPVFLRRKK